MCNISLKITLFIHDVVKSASSKSDCQCLNSSSIIKQLFNLGKFLNFSHLLFFSSGIIIRLIKITHDTLNIVDVLRKLANKCQLSLLLYAVIYLFIYSTYIYCRTRCEVHGNQRDKDFAPVINELTIQLERETNK